MERSYNVRDLSSKTYNVTLTDHTVKDLRKKLAEIKNTIPDLISISHDSKELKDDMELTENHIGKNDNYLVFYVRRKIRKSKTLVDMNAVINPDVKKEDIKQEKTIVEQRLTNAGLIETKEKIYTEDDHKIIKEWNAKYMTLVICETKKMDEVLQKLIDHDFSIGLCLQAVNSNETAKEIFWNIIFAHYDRVVELMKSIKNINYITTTEYDVIKYSVNEFKFPPELVIDCYYKHEKNMDAVNSILFEMLS